MLRTIDWVDGSIELIDQTLLPNEVKVLRVSDLDTLIECVQRLAVRGAPALGVAGAMGVALIAQTESDPGSISSLAQTLSDARPTAVNLSWGVKRALTRLDEGPDARVVGISGNREFSVDYRPKPYVEMINSAVGAAPSLYDWQLARRLDLD